MPGADIPCVSTTLLLSQRKVMEDLVGAHVVTRALSRLPDEVRIAYEGIVPLSWFPVAWFNDVVTAVATEAGGNVLAFHAEVLHTNAERTVSKLWRVFLRFTSDEALMSRTPVLYSRSYTQGELTAKFRGPGRMEVTLRGWPDVPDIQVQVVKVGVGTVLKFAGRKHLHVTADRRPTGALFTATWRP